MTELKRKGNVAELAIALDLVRRGYQVAIPFGEAADFDLIFVRPGEVPERVQVKHTTSDGAVIQVRCCSHSLTNGKVRVTKEYTADTIDWLAVYDATTERCFYVPASELGTGRRRMLLRLDSPFVGWRSNMHRAEDYTDPELPLRAA